MSKRFSAVGPLLASGMVLSALYVGSYAFLVESSASPGDPLTNPRVANYRYGGTTAKVVFFPIERLDRKLRHEYWTTPDCMRFWERES